MVLRSKRLKGRALADCAARAADLCRSRGARLVLNGPAELAAEVGAAGVHLTAARARALREQGASLPDGLLCGASCHDEAELATAVALGVDYLLCSPVRATTSHPGVDGMGWERFAALCARAPVPVYALGGVAPSDLARAMACGGQGVAGILRFWHR